MDMRRPRPIIRNIYAITQHPVGATKLGRLLLAFSIFTGAVVIFAFLARNVASGATLSTDQQLLMAINTISSPQLDQAVIAVSATGGVAAVFLFTAVIAFLLARQQKWQAFTQLAVGVLGAGVCNGLLKLLFERDRPQLWEWAVHESTYSFPSGHAMLSSALVFSIILLTWHTRYRTYIITCGIIYMLAIGLSRLYLGVHYPTDVIAGWCVSFAWIVATAAIIGAINWPTRPFGKRGSKRQAP